MPEERILLKSVEEVLSVIAAHEGYDALGFDTETDSIKGVRANLVGIGLSWEAGTGYYIPIAHYEEPNVPLEPLLPALTGLMATKKIVYHNAKYDWQVQDRAGIPRPERWEDTMLAAHSLGIFDQLGLKDLALRLLKIKMITLEDLFGGRRKDINFPTLAPEAARPYAAADPDITLRIWHSLEPRVANLFIYKLEHELMPWNCDTEENGFKLDPPYMAAEAKRLTEEISHAADHLYDLIGEALSLDPESTRVMFPVNSSPKIGDLLYDRLGLKCRKTTDKGSRSTDGDALNPYRKTNKIVANLLAVREMTRQRDTYYIKLTKFMDENDRVHSDLNQTGASSGRWSSSDPNLQNIAKMVKWIIYRLDGASYEVVSDARLAFVAADGYYLMEFDQDQVELRFLAGAAQERTLLQGFARGDDLHTRTASYSFGVPESQVTPEQRDDGKTTNYALMYGMGPDHFFRELEGRYDMSVVEEMHRRYFELYSGIIPYHLRMRRESKVTHSITSYFGRYQRIPEFDLPGAFNKSKAERAGVARYVQGSCADMMKIIVTRLMRHLSKHYSVATHGRIEGTDIRSLLYLHDGNYFEVRNTIDPYELAAMIAKVATLEFPKFPIFRLSFKTGQRWGGEMKKLPFDDPIPLQPRIQEEAVVETTDTEDQHFVYELDTLSNTNAVQLRELLKSTPGNNSFEIILDGNKLEIPYKTSLTPADTIVQNILGDPFKSDEEIAAEVAEDIEIILE